MKSAAAPRRGPSTHGADALSAGGPPSPSRLQSGGSISRAIAGFASPVLISAIVFLSGVVVSVAIHLAIREADRDQLRSRIQSAVDNRVQALRAATRSYEDSLHSLRTLYTFSTDVSHEEFRGATRSLLNRYPGIGAFEWAPLVAGPDRAAVEERIGRTVQAGYRFLNRVGVSGLATAPPAEEYLPLIYVEPLHPNQPALGFNLLSGTSHQEITLARQSGRIMLSRVTPLFVSGSATTGFVIYLPVYEGFPEPGIAPPAQTFRGMLMAVFRLDRFFAEAPDRIAAVGYDLLVIDRTARNADGVIALHRENGTTQTTDLPTAAAFVNAESQRIPFELWSRDWELIFRPSEAWMESVSRRQPYAVLVLGIMVSGVFSLLLNGRLRYTVQIEQQVFERTAELRAAQHELEEDVKRRTEAESALAQSEERYRAFMAQSADAIWRCEFDEPWPDTGSVDDQITFLQQHSYLAECNDATARMYGRQSAQDLVGTHWRDLHDSGNESFRTFLRAFVTQGFRTQDAEIHDTDPTGRPRIFLCSLVGIVDHGRPVRTWGTQRDITTQRRAEQEKSALERKLQESQKLESLGVLAGGIAHDFNNLLTGILGNAGLLNLSLPPGSPDLVHIREIESASLRAAELCKQMLAYSGKGRFIIEPVDLGELVQSTVPLLRLSISKSARLHFRLAESLPAVMADPTQMRQILMNLVINASDALGAQAGDITLTTGVIHADRHLLRTAVLSPSVPEGDYTYLEVSDTGCGMSADTLARIFDPFFTTKFAGRGLGLAAVLGIVRGHLGALFVETAPGKGATFRLLLPVAKGSPLPAVRSGPGSQTPWRCSGRILLVDDEDAVRFVGSHMLRSFGLTVETAVNGAEAIARFERSADFDLVMLDLTMPGIPGEDVLRRLRALKPTLPVLLMSGFTEQEVTQRFGPDQPVTFIQKPFTVAAIRAQLRKMLDSPSIG